MKPMRRAGDIRPIERSDIPMLADLMAKSFSLRPDACRSAVQKVLLDLTVDHPVQKADIASLVSTDQEGHPTGFLGVMPRTMIFDGGERTAAIVFSQIVADPEKTPLVGAQLLLTLFKGQQDLVIAENATSRAQQQWLNGGARLMPCYSMNWYHIVNQFGSAVSLLENGRLPHARLLRPVSSAIDSLAKKVAGKKRLQNGDAQPAPVQCLDADEELFGDVLEACSADFGLRPAIDRALLKRQLESVATQNLYGPMHCRVMLGRKEQPLGCYLLQGSKGGRAHVSHFSARRKATGQLFENLIQHSSELGCAMVQGRTNPILMEVLVPAFTRFKAAHGMLVHSRDEKILQAVYSGEALIDGLAGNTWTLFENHKLDCRPA